MTAVEEIKNWMKENGISRDQLGEKVLVKKKTVDGWLSSGKTIPAPKLELIEKLMSGDEEIFIPLPDDFEDYVRSQAEALKQSIDEFVMDILKKAALSGRKTVPAEEAKEERYTIPFRGIVYAENLYSIPVMGNVAAGSQMEGDSIPYEAIVCKKYPEGSYALRVSGSSMSPKIPADSLVVVKPWKSTDLPKLGTIVVYYDGRGVALKKLAKQEDKYVLKSLNPAFPDIHPIEGEGCISAIYVETIEKEIKPQAPL